MEALFTQLSHAIEGAAWLALAASFAWGVLSIVLSPCHLASIPLIVGFIDDQGRVNTFRAFLISLLFAAGILATISAVGIITAAAGRMMGDLGSTANYLVAFIFLAIGLHLLEILPLPLSGSGNIAYRKKGLIAALVLGLVFGIALGPCTFAYMAPMLGVTFKTASRNLLYGAALLVAYGLGHCSVIVAAGTFTGVVQQYLNWNERSRGAVILKKICGMMVLCGGLYLIYTS